MCPESTASEHENPCPAGKFNNETMRTDLSQCQDCPGTLEVLFDFI